MIQVHGPLFLGNEKKYLNQCIETGWISSQGPFVGEFETKFKNYLGTPYATTASSGTAALEMACHALDLCPDDEIIVPSLTIISCALSIIRAKCRPVFSDVDIETWNIDHTQIEKCLSNKTKAIMVVHHLGLPCPMKDILALADKYNLFVIEDCAEALGSEIEGQKVGTFGDVAIFSFFSNKLISCGEGGMLVTKTPQILEKAKSYKNLYFGKINKFIHEDIGQNFRLSNLQAAVGLAQLEQIETLLEKKLEIAKKYHQAFQGIDGMTIAPTLKNTKNSYWMFGIVNKKNSNTHLGQYLKDLGIDSRPFFYGLHLQPCLNNFVNINHHLTNTEYLSKHGLYLPSGPDLSATDQEFVIKSVIEYFQ